MASNIHNIKLFTDSFIKKIHKCPSSSLIEYHLLPFITWFDNTVLIELVAACEKIGILEQLYKFNDCITNDNQLITSYSIPKFSQLIIPLDDSEYTIIAIKTFQNCVELVLQDVKDIKEFLTSQWEITAHAIQLAAIDYQYNFIYWMIPKQVQPLIENKLSEAQYYLWRGGIFQADLLPSNFYCIENDFDQQIANNPFNISKLLLKDSLKVCRKCFISMASSNSVNCMCTLYVHRYMYYVCIQMYMCVCMYVCMYVCIYVCLCACMCVCVTLSHLRSKGKASA